MTDNRSPNSFLSTAAVLCQKKYPRASFLFLKIGGLNNFAVSDACHSGNKSGNRRMWFTTSIINQRNGSFGYHLLNI